MNVWKEWHSPFHFCFITLADRRRKISDTISVSAKKHNSSSKRANDLLERKTIRGGFLMMKTAAEFHADYAMRVSKEESRRAHCGDMRLDLALR